MSSCQASSITTNDDGPTTSDYKIMSVDPLFDYQLHPKAGESSVQLPLEKSERVLIQLGLVRKAKLGPAFGEDPKGVTMNVQAQSSSRLQIEIQNAHKKAWKIPHNIVSRHPPQFPTDYQQPNQKLDYKVVWNDPASFSFTVLRSETGEKLFDTSSFGLTIKDQYIELSTHLADGAPGRVANLFGLGENVGSLRREPGTTTTLWARDCPCEPGTNLYGSHPFYMEILPSGSAHGVLLLSSNGMDIVFSPEGDKLTYKIIGGIIELYVFTGPTPQQVIQQYTELIGRPCMIPYYAQGFHICRWGYDTLGKIKDVVSNFRKHSLPLESIWVDIDYMKDYRCFTIDEGRFPTDQLAKFVDDLHAQDQHIVMILDPGIKVQYQSGLYEPYDEGVAKGLFIKRKVTRSEESKDGKVYNYGDLVDFVGKVWPGKTVFPDWLHPETQAYWTKHITEWCEKVSLDGIWIDMNEPASFHDGDCSYIELSKDRPVRISDFAMADDTGLDEEKAPEHQLQQPQHADSSTRKRIRENPNTTSPVGEEFVEHGLHHIDKHQKHKHSESSGDALYSDNQEALSLNQKSPLVYSMPNDPPYRINNNNKYADLEYRSISTDALHHGGILEYDVHNLFGHMEAIATYNALRTINPEKKPFILSRSTFPGSGQYVCKWNGDNWSTEFDMKASIAGLLNFQFFGISMIGADIGGFGGTATEELLIRWQQLGAFYPFMRNHNCITNPPQEPYITECLAEISRKYLDIRYRLLPYWYTLFFRSHHSGHMVCSPLWILDPSDQDLLTNYEQFLVGESILVSPALRLGQKTVDIRFPAGQWYNIHSGILEVSIKPGKHGSTILPIPAPLNEMPVHVLGGNILPRAGIKKGSLISTTTQVHRAPIQVLIALDETECAKGEYYHDDDSFQAMDGTLVKFKVDSGLFGMSSFPINNLETSDNKRGACGMADALIVPTGNKNLRSTFIESIVVWGIGNDQVESSRILNSGIGSSSCHVEQHQVRVSIVDRVDTFTESVQHQRELTGISKDEFDVTWSAEKAILGIRFKREEGLEVKGDQALEVDWTEALVA